jgi:hypothetical protein
MSPSNSISINSLGLHNVSDDSNESPPDACIGLYAHAVLPVLGDMLGRGSEEAQCILTLGEMLVPMSCHSLISAAYLLTNNEETFAQVLWKCPYLAQQASIFLFTPSTTVSSTLFRNSSCS